MLHVQTNQKNIERRRHLRVPTWQSAELFTGNDRTRRICMVLDRSSSGVQIELGETIDLPERMIIQFSSEASQLVRRCWAAGTRAGVEFVGASSAPDTNNRAGSGEGAVLECVPEPSGLAEIASQVAALLRQMEAKLRDHLGIEPGADAVFFSETGSRTGGEYRHKVTIIAPQAEAAARRIEAAINDMQSSQKPATEPHNEPPGESVFSISKALSREFC